jgi:glycosyltransferase involved in cell wall biosynthesis
LTPPSDAATPARRLRLLQITEDLGVGGLERVVATIARKVDRSRFEPQVLCLRDTGPFAVELEAEGIPVHCLGYGKDRADYGAFVHVARLLREQRIDVIHSHNTNALLAAGMGALLAGGRTIVHTDHARAHPDKLRYYIAEHLISYGVFRMVGVSDETTAALRRHEWIPRRKLATIENGIDEEPYERSYDPDSLRASLDIPPGVPVIGMIARLSQQKGTTYLLTAMEQIAREAPDVVLVIAGDGAERPALEAQAAAAGLTGNVRFLGTRHDGAALLRLFDLFMLPSVWEGLPLAILEAMAARTAIVASAVGGIPTVLTDGETATLIPPKAPDAIARAVIALLRSPETRDKHRVAARRLFEARYAARVMVRKYEALYERRVSPATPGSNAPVPPGPAG